MAERKILSFPTRALAPHAVPSMPDLQYTLFPGRDD